MDFGLVKGEVAIVTGASRGISRAIAVELAKAGADVIVNYKTNEKDANAVEEEIRSMEGNAWAFQADVSDEKNVREMVAFTISKLKHIDILVNNAGVVRDQLLGTMSLKDWESVMQTNLQGVFLCIREVLPYMMTQKHGSIINLSSIAADRGGRGHCNYAAAKGGINAMTKSLAVELARKGIRVNAVSPGIILTDMTNRIRMFAPEEIKKQIPLKRCGTAQDVAKAVRFLASKDASYITGEVLHVTGGLGV